MNIRLNYTPRPWQHHCHSKRRRFSVYALHRRAGKTQLALMELIDAAVANKLELPFFVYLAPLLKQARAIAWARLKAILQPLIEAEAVEAREGDMLVRFRHNGAVIQLFGADNPDALRGIRLDGAVVDEVAQIAPEVWTEIIQPALADRMGWAMFIGTPHGINLFSELFYAATSKPDWHAARFTVYDTNALDPGEVARQKAEMPDNAFAREFLCDFSAAGDDQLISLLEAEEASRRAYKEQDITHAPRILGVDVARFGDDRSVIVKRQGLVMFDPVAMQGIDNMTLASRVANVIAEWKPHAVFIDMGGGAGVIDRLRQLGHQVIEVAFGGKALKERLFLNRRAEMWTEMANWLRAGGAIPNDSALKQELATPIYWLDNQGRRVLEPKDDIKKRLQGGSSPDIADALALTFASPVVTPEQQELAHRRHDTTQPRNPVLAYEQSWRGKR